MVKDADIMPEVRQIRQRATLVCHRCHRKKVSRIHIVEEDDA
jgi:hypothetical protein